MTCHPGLSARSINTIVGEIGHLHDARTSNPDSGRELGTLGPRDARHAFACHLSPAYSHNRAVLERRLGHADDQYLHLYTNPPDDVAAGHMEHL